MQDDSDGGTPEAVAYRLMLRILAAEGRPLGDWKEGSGKFRRDRVLDCYAQCLEATTGRWKVPDPNEARERRERRVGAGGETGSES